MIIAIAAGERPEPRARRTPPGRRDDPPPRPDAAPPRTDRPRPARRRALGSAVVDREITLRDYGRVVWSGRWLILATTVAAAVVGLLLTFVTSTTYTATARVFLGQATTVSGAPFSTPATNPATAADGPDRRQPRDPRGRGDRRHAGPRAQERVAHRAAGAGRRAGQPAHRRHDHVQGRQPPGRAARAPTRTPGRSTSGPWRTSRRCSTRTPPARPAAQADVTRLQGEIAGYQRQLARPPATPRAAR